MVTDPKREDSEQLTMLRAIAREATRNTPPKGVAMVDQGRSFLTEAVDALGYDMRTREETTAEVVMDTLAAAKAVCPELTDEHAGAVLQAVSLIYIRPSKDELEEPEEPEEEQPEDTG